MRSVKKIILISTAGFALSACGGGGGSETPVSFNPVTPPVADSQYDIQTKAARDAFEQRLASALEASETWLDANRRNADVITTQSGLQYRIDKASPNPDGKRYDSDQTVIVHYEGQLIDGTVFDSSFDRGRPEQLKPSELIEGWQEALNLMQPGDEWTLFIPPALAYGELGKGGGIPANAALIFKVELR
jgi:FKBP-type peptidyl-prolyl cis-trans isomerase